MYLTEGHVYCKTRAVLHLPILGLRVIRLSLAESVYNRAVEELLQCNHNAVEQDRLAVVSNAAHSFFGSSPLAWDRKTFPGPGCSPISDPTT